MGVGVGVPEGALRKGRQRQDPGWNVGWEPSVQPASRWREARGCPNAPPVTSVAACTGRAPQGGSQLLGIIGANFKGKKRERKVTLREGRGSPNQESLQKAAPLTGKRATSEPPQVQTSRSELVHGLRGRRAPLPSWAPTGPSHGIAPCAPARAQHRPQTENCAWNPGHHQLGDQRTEALAPFAPKGRSLPCVSWGEPSGPQSKSLRFPEAPPDHPSTQSICGWEVTPGHRSSRTRGRLGLQEGGK